MDIYGSILSIFNTLNESALKVESEQKNMSKNESLSNGFLHNTSMNGTKNLTNIMDEEREKLDKWAKIFEKITPQIVSTITSDITFAPLYLKVKSKRFL